MQTAPGVPALRSDLQHLIDVGVSPDGVVHFMTKLQLRYVSPADGKVYDEAGSIVGTFFEPLGLFNGDGPATARYLSIPAGVAYDSSGGAWIADRGNHRMRYVRGGTMTTLAGNGSCCVGGRRATTASGALPNVQMGRPGGIAVNDGGDIVVTDQDNYSAHVTSGPAGNQSMSRFAGIDKLVCGWGSDSQACPCSESNYRSTSMRFRAPLKHKQRTARV